MINKEKLAAYIELSKPSILGLVLVTTALGYYLGGKGVRDWGILAWTLLGAALTCAGAGALNHYLERDSDALMKRTKNRPLPKGTLTPADALSYGIVTILSGAFLLCWKVNLLIAFLSLLTAFLYVLVYTPIKKISWLNTTIGAIPGAIPPMGGWVAATGHLDPGAWVLFFILFAWQHPHFYAIAWLCKEDYAKAGFKMLPVVDPDGISTFRQTIFYCLLLLAVSVLPSFMGMSGKIYLAGAVVLGSGFVYAGWRLLRSHSMPDARRLLGASVLYLPLLLFVIILDLSIL
jgi:protoheme IX farnesyltransferase